MATSLEDYYNLIFWINYFVYLSYFFIKYLVAPILWFILEWADRRQRKEGQRDKSCLGRFAKTTKLMQSVVLLVFGKQLAIKRLDDNKDKNDIPEFILRKRRLSYGATMVLFVLVATFGVLAVGSALDLTLLSITHICSEDPTIDCYPQRISGANATGLNISTQEPILDCTFWNSDGVSDRVTFVCYQFVLNVELFLAVIGGLLAFFIYAMKTTITVLLFLSVCCLGGCEDESKSEKGCRSCICVTRIGAAILASVIEIVVAVVCLVLGATGSTVDSTNDTPELMFVAMHASEVLVVFGIIATSLWLPWEDYTKAYKKNANGKSPEEIEMKMRHS